MLLEDGEVLNAMEPEDAEKKVLTRIFLADREKLKMLESYVFQLLKKGVNDIASGNVSPNPYSRGTSFDACAFCPYGAVCHPDRTADRRNYKEIKEDQFWETVEKEVLGHEK